MILKKRFYTSRGRFLEYFKSLTSMLKGIFVRPHAHLAQFNDHDHKTLLVYPEPKADAFEIEGKWDECLIVCPTNCLTIEVEGERLKSFDLDLVSCIGCGECIKVAPGFALESRPLNTHLKL